MKIWKNTTTLDSFFPEFLEMSSPVEAEIAVLGSKAIDLNAFPRLKGIFKCGVGTDNIPFGGCLNRKIEVGLPSDGTREIIYDETASFSTALVYRMLYSDVGSVAEWSKRRRAYSKNRVVLIVGRGKIGSRVADRLKPAVQVETFDLLENPIELLDTLLPIADVVSLHIPLTNENEGFWGREKLALMKEGACLVNAARGNVVDENALYEEIDSGRLRAAFDVFWEEPYQGKLARFHPDRFYMTPHVASSCIEFTKGLADDFMAFRKALQNA